MQRVLCVRGHSVQPLRNALGLLFSLLSVFNKRVYEVQTIVTDDRGVSPRVGSGA